ncbi:hypothetical protein [Kluyvera intermedia]|uniref:DUF4747 family protein n=1 Tax=Kluyvera intermedia TaxID=61648 RepID=A0ABX6DST1_KLUIN|nr:hypothetical protein [Kluyvera intermedia]QGH30829.1 hypothetical protein GHC21_14595 [Kluyvera intermedia]QGH39811.1 hypothetical protein GHC38_14595 [Kluyvera intermedia]
MSFTKTIEFANYTLNFGTDKVLLDAFECIVKPSFIDEKYIRKFKDTEYFFTDTKLIVLNSEDQIDTEFVGPHQSVIPTLALCGRIIKKTTFKREQIFQDGNLIKDHKTLESHPSSIFVLMLNDHRLMLCKEVPGAPTLEEFENTSRHCLAERYNSFVDYEIKKNKRLRKKKTHIKRLYKKEIYEKLSVPRLRVTPLTDSRTLNNFVELFSVVNKLSIELLPTNSENISLDDFWEKIEEEKNDLNSNKAQLVFTNRTEDGLNSNAVIEKTASATRMANSKVIISGKDENGARLSGNNESFTLKAPKAQLSSDIDRAAQEAYATFNELKEEGNIVTPDRHDRAKILSRITTIINRWL